MGYSGAGGKLIHENNQKQKISWHCPIKELSPLLHFIRFLNLRRCTINERLTLMKILWKAGEIIVIYALIIFRLLGNSTKAAKKSVLNITITSRLEF